MISRHTIYVCTKCDSQFSKWSGRCLECSAWGTLKEESASAARSAPGGTKSKVKGQKIDLLKTSAAPAKVARFEELVGGKLTYVASNAFPASKIFKKGIVLGSISLLAGEPGAGKSTLSLQIAHNVSMRAPVLYVSAEESITQVKARGDRLGLFSRNFFIAESHELEAIVSTVEQHKPQLVVIDSLQSITSVVSDADAGSINQIKIVTASLSQLAKSSDVAIIVIGHVTKDGALAGPKSLEHLVDAVYYLDSDRRSHYRLLRCFKNRYGGTGTVSVMQQTTAGLKEIRDAATIFIQHYKAKPGSAVTITSIDNQLFFIEVQALVSRSSFGYAKRTSSGFPKSRLELLLAIVKKNLHVDCDTYDVFINIAGGFNINEPAMDLAVVLSVLSSLKDAALPEGTVAFGEVGLSGELRVVKDTGARLKEIERNKFKRVIMPQLDTKVHSVLRVEMHETLGSVVQALKW